MMTYLFRLLLFLRPAWVESPSIIPAQSPPSGIISVNLRDLRDELKLRAVTTESDSLTVIEQC
jgi:hypothetical protein